MQAHIPCMYDMGLVLKWTWGGWYCWCVCNPANQLDMVNVSLPFTWFHILQGKNGRYYSINGIVAGYPPILKPFSIFLSVFGTIGLRNTQPFYCFRLIGYSTYSWWASMGGDPIYPPEGKRKIIDYKVRWEKEMFSSQEGKPPCFFHYS